MGRHSNGATSLATLAVRPTVGHDVGMAKTEVWTTEKVAEHCGLDAKNVRKYMTRWGVPSVGREPGRGGANLYPAKAVRAAKEKAPGKGNRTPRKPKPDA